MHIESFNSQEGEDRSMKIRETIQSDIDFMKDHSVSRGILKNQPEQMEFCYSLEHEGKLLCIGGFRLINLTTSWCWLDLSTEAGGHIRTVYRIIKEWIEEFAKDNNIKRLQCYIEPDFPEAIRTVQHLGFEKESILEGFLPNGNALLYRRLF